MVAKGQLFPVDEDAGELTPRGAGAAHACNIFAPTPTNSIKFPVYGSLFLYVPAPQVPQERSVNAKIIAPFRTSPHRFCYPPAIQSIRWRLYSMSNSRAAAEQTLDNSISI